MMRTDFTIRSVLMTVFLGFVAGGALAQSPTPMPTPAASGSGPTCAQLVSTLLSVNGMIASLNDLKNELAPQITEAGAELEMLVERFQLERWLPANPTPEDLARVAQLEAEIIQLQYAIQGMLGKMNGYNIQLEILENNAFEITNQLVALGCAVNF